MNILDLIVEHRLYDVLSFYFHPRWHAQMLKQFYFSRPSTIQTTTLLQSQTEIIFICIFLNACSLKAFLNTESQNLNHFSTSKFNILDSPELTVSLFLLLRLRSSLLGFVLLNLLLKFQSNKSTFETSPRSGHTQFHFTSPRVCIILIKVQIIL